MSRFHPENEMGSERLSNVHKVTHQVRISKSHSDCITHSASISGPFPIAPRGNRPSLALKPDQADTLGTLTRKAPIDEDTRDRLSNLWGRRKQGGAGQPVTSLALEEGDVGPLQHVHDAAVPSTAFRPGDHKTLLDAAYDGALTTFHYSPFCLSQLKLPPPVSGPESFCWDPQPCLSL